MKQTFLGAVAALMAMPIKAPPPYEDVPDVRKFAADAIRRSRESVQKSRATEGHFRRERETITELLDSMSR